VRLYTGQAFGSVFTSLVLLVLAGIRTAAVGQGPTSAAIAGRVVDRGGRGLQGVEVRVVNQATGVAMRGSSRAEGRYLISGLEVGGPYAVTARRLGSPPASRSGIFLSLGQQLNVDLVLEQQPVLLQGIEARSTMDRAFSRSHTGVEALVSDSVIHEMPVINRDLYDLVRLVPQTSTWYALTASGAGPRVNSIRIDGISDQVPSSNLAAGALYGGKVIPLDAVKEYDVLFSPFDVRHGSFAGASVNVVTRSGTNELHGSLFGYGTNEQLGPNVPFVRRARYEKEQFGLSVGGPIVRDKLLFFLSSELQRRVIPAVGPYIADGAASQSMVPVAPADVARFQQLLSARGLDAGSADAVSNPNPSSTVFLRLDAPVPRWNSRFTLRGSYGNADSSIFARPTTLAPTNCPTSACFPLSSLQHSRWVDKRTVAAQLMSNLPRGAYNELLVGYLDIVSGFRPTVDEPLILVTVPGTAGTPAVLQAGTHEIATGQRNASWTTELTDNLSVSTGAHRVTVGASAQLFDLRAFQLRGAYGVWEFASLDSLATGAASRYRITRDTGSVTAVSGAYPSFYVGDEWEASSRLSLTLGLRADGSVLSARPPYVRAVDSAFHLRTDEVPSGHVQWSPRLGFNYRLTDDASSQMQARGGVGLFTGRPPMFWLFGGFAAYGLATRTLQCGSLPGDAGPAPDFRADFRNPPMACAGGRTFGGATSGEIDVIDPHLRLPQTLRASLAVDKQLPLGVLGTIEGLYTHSRRALFFSPINLAGPASDDGRGRSMYGTISAEGVATPSRVSSGLGDVIAITTESKDYAYDVTSELRRDGRTADLNLAISFGRSRDVQSPRPVSALLTDDWRFARPVAGRENDLALGTSDFDQPVRVRASGTLHSPWRTYGTDLSFFYVGGSGFPYTYVAGGAQGRGDLNADGAVGNDPIYIPRSAFDTTEIRFAGSQAEILAQQTALEHFIGGAKCLRVQRGRIMSRNSCRSPWMNLTNVAVRQGLPGVPGQSLAVEIQVFNLLNLLDQRWGRMRLPTGTTLASTNQMTLLSQTGQTTGRNAQPIYRFDPTMPRYSDENFDTYYQIQVAVRYNF
jgi:hypothetical protein